MSRIFLKALLFLLIGAVVNVALAWSFAAWSSIQLFSGQAARPPTPPGKVRPDYGWLAPEHLDWPLPVPADWDSPQNLGWSESTGIRLDAGLVESKSADAYLAADGKTWHWARMYRYGWPLYSMAWYDGSDAYARGGETGIRGRLRSGVALPASLGRISRSVGYPGPYSRRLPLQPVWEGFAVNSVLYASAAVAAVLGPHWVIRLRRRRRGLCETCGYDAGESPVCSECGNPVNPRPAAPA
jgi:hypothetical protein